MHWLQLTYVYYSHKEALYWIFIFLFFFIPDGTPRGKRTSNKPIRCPRSTEPNREDRSIFSFNCQSPVSVAPTAWHHLWHRRTSPSWSSAAAMPTCRRGIRLVATASQEIIPVSKERKIFFLRLATCWKWLCNVAGWFCITALIGLGPLSPQSSCASSGSEGRLDEASTRPLSTGMRGKH